MNTRSAIRPIRHHSDRGLGVPPELSRRSAAPLECSGKMPKPRNRDAIFTASLYSDESANADTKIAKLKFQVPNKTQNGKGKSRFFSFAFL